MPATTTNGATRKATFFHPSFFGKHSSSTTKIGGNAIAKALHKSDAIMSATARGRANGAPSRARRYASSEASMKERNSGSFSADTHATDSTWIGCTANNKPATTA